MKNLLRDAIRQRPSRRYGKKQYLWRAGDKCSGLWLIKFGTVRTFYFNDNGEEHITGFYLPGEYIGAVFQQGGIHLACQLWRAYAAKHVVSLYIYDRHASDNGLG
ncbi:Crp/Fnr family transcriptional regulator [Enterobacter kobei]|uniref:Crp/Fnr family transcriptional regulator n=1 Tax=Enterobacter cloacae complex TaxID=354276 RepID=UPI003567686F|nr:cyclic nucleotide-binding domain-containing protein [Enterobacter asburiae]